MTDGAPALPPHNAPRTWLITQALSPIAVRLMRLLVAHGDYIVACLPPEDMSDDARTAEFRALAETCRATPSWKDHIRGVRCDGRLPGSCSTVVAEAVAVFGHIDVVLCCAFEAAVGSVEEIGGGAFYDDFSCATAQARADAAATQNMVLDQFNTNFFSQVNFIKAALPQLRAQRTGHILVLSNVGGHMGTPGLPVNTAATWALEGYCDSLAYEVAPFNVKVTIVQPQTEVLLLTNRLAFAPVMPAYQAAAAAAAAAVASYAHEDEPDVEPDDETELEDSLNSLESLEDSSFRSFLCTTINAHAPPADHVTEDTLRAAREPVRRYPRLPKTVVDRLVRETVHALAAIGGHESPPTRHIVGSEATAAVADKLKTVSEELEDFVETSVSVDIFDSALKQEARATKGLATQPEQS